MDMHQRILLVGAFATDPSIYTYATSFLSTLKALNYPVTTLNYRIKSTPFNTLNQYIINQRLIRLCSQEKPNLVFIIKGEIIRPRTLKIIKQKAPSTRIINFYPDNPFALWNGNSTEHILKSLPLFDCFMSWSPELRPILHTAGSSHTCFFPFAYDETIFERPITITEPDKQTYSSDVCFVGTWEPEREQLLAHIKQCLPSLKLAIWGNLWNENCTTSSVHASVKGNAIYGQAMIKAFKCSTIVLNFIRKQNALGHNMRTFEAPASKAFMLTQWTHEQAHVLFQENTNLICFKNNNDLIDKITYYMLHKKERDMITKKSYDHVQNYKLKKQLKNFFNTCCMMRRLVSHDE